MKHNLQKARRVISAATGAAFPTSSLNTPPASNFYRNLPVRLFNPHQFNTWGNRLALENVSRLGESPQSWESFRIDIPKDPTWESPKLDEMRIMYPNLNKPAHLYDPDSWSSLESLSLLGPSYLSHDDYFTIEKVIERVQKLEELERQKQQERIDKYADLGLWINTGINTFTLIGDVLGQHQAVTDSEVTKSITTGYDAILSGLEKAGHIGKAIAGGMGAAQAAGDIMQSMGLGTDLMTTTDQWMDSPVFSWWLGAANGAGATRSDSFSADMSTLNNIGSSYGGALDIFSEAEAKSGKKYGWFSGGARREANRFIANAHRVQNLMANISNNAMDLRMIAQSSGEAAGLAHSMMMDGGYNQKFTYSAKHGGVINSELPEILEWEPLVELNWKLPEFKEGGNIDIIEELEWIPELQNGGTISSSDIPETEETTQKNVIPEGALHKNKHHMEHAEGLTKKGIPVIDDNGELQAEIEHSEIIFTLEVTKKLEEYYDTFYSEESTNKEKEQAALDAGKLLVYLILENTEDRTGLIESCKLGGTLTVNTTRKETKPDDKKDVYRDLVKDIIKETLTEILNK